jgi:hypothetical protein
MGQKSAKQNLTQQFNFQQYGLSDEEGANLKKYFNQSANRQHELLEADFKKVYLQLNPTASTKQVQEAAKKVYTSAGTSRFMYDEFIGVYVMLKSPPQEMAKNMKAYLKTLNQSFITKDQANRYAKFIHTFYGKTQNAPLPETTANKFADSYGDKIPTEQFLDYIAPYYFYYDCLV